MVYRNDHIGGTEDLAFMKFGDNSWQNNIFKLSTIASKRSPGQTMAFWVTTGNNIKFPTLQQQISLTDIPVDQPRALVPEKMKSLEIGVNLVSQPKDVPNIDQIEFQGSFLFPLNGFSVHEKRMKIVLSNVILFIKILC